MHIESFATVALMICVAAGSYLAGCCNGAIITSALFYLVSVLPRRYPQARQRQRRSDELLPHLRRKIRARRHSGRYAQGVRRREARLDRIRVLSRRAARRRIFFRPVLRHIFPAFYSFRGGKGILCSGTLLLLLDWRVAAVGWGLFLILWLTTRYVSLGSVTGAVSFPITTAIFYWGSWVVVALSLLIAGLVVWAHRANIGRLLRGTESKFQWHKNAPGQP